MIKEAEKSKVKNPNGAPESTSRKKPKKIASKNLGNKKIEANITTIIIFQETKKIAKKITEENKILK